MAKQIEVKRRNRNRAGGDELYVIVKESEGAHAQTIYLEDSDIQLISRLLDVARKDESLKALTA